MLLDDQEHMTVIYTMSVSPRAHHSSIDDD